MKKVWSYLKAHWRDDFSLSVYLTVAMILAGLLIFNYTIDFEDSFLDANRGWRKYFYYLAFYSIPYYSTVAICSRDRSVLRSRSFLLKSFLGLAVLSLDASLPFMRWLLLDTDGQIFLWVYKVTINMISLVTVVAPLYLHYRFAENQREGFYGLTPKRFDASPYLQMLLIMIRA